MDEAGVCLSLHIVVVVVGGLFLVVAIVALVWKIRQWRMSRWGTSNRYGVKYNSMSEENRTYQTAHVNPEEGSISGCEIYGRQEDLLTDDQRRRFGLINVNKGTQTPLETMLYSNYPSLMSKIDDAFRGKVETRKLTRGEKMNTDYDYPLMLGRTSKYLRKRRSKSSRNSKSSCDVPPPHRRRRLPSPCSNPVDRVRYINSHLRTASSCPCGEDALSSESQTCSDVDSDDTGSSDYDSDPPKILLDKKLIAYVKKLERKHTVYIEKYKTLRNSHKKCSKSVSLELPICGHRRRANTGVLKLLDRKKTKVCKTFSIPVNIETVCHNKPIPKPCRYNQAPKPGHHCQVPKPCLSEENYLTILS